MLLLVDIVCNPLAYFACAKMSTIFNLNLGSSDICIK